MVKTWSTPVTEEETRPVPCTLCGGTAFFPRFTCGENALPFRYVRCGKCGLVQINPQPGPAAVAVRYGSTEDKNSGCGGDYLAYERANEKSFLRLQELALDDAGFFDLEEKLLSPSAPPDPPGALHPPAALDVGCATGALLALLRDRGWAVRGLEISPPQAEYCRRRSLEVSALSLEQAAFPPENFDAILASHLIEHLNDPGNFVREAYRICKPGGRFYVTTPNIAGFQARIFGSRWRSAIFDHLYLFSVKTLRALLEGAGFTVEKIRTWGGLAAGIAPGPVKSMADVLAKTLGAGDVMILRAARRS
ncbi:MAG: class I SAM-dependent methyltransferase [Treponema sp.]|jgi:SAM-dependent methyltransferase|nr:class I SAM-dependent methyltransferase [Treponema sp.]